MLYRNLPVFVIVITLLAVTFFLIGSAHAQFRASLAEQFVIPKGRRFPARQ
jgi:hypothetical protein